MVHELGHAYDQQHVANLRDDVKHLHERTKSEKLRKMKDVTDQPYGPDELTRPDEFYDAYMGKDYSKGMSKFTTDMYKEAGIQFVPDPCGTKHLYILNTEMTSMSLDMMVEDPMGFAAGDPKSFDWVFETVMR